MKTGILRFKKLPATLEECGMPNDIPIITGSYYYDIDVREDALDKDVVENMSYNQKFENFWAADLRFTAEDIDENMLDELKMISKIAYERGAEDVKRSDNEKV